ncbi:hypothetical protein RYX36_026573, partial [Vicia faba]
GALRNAISTFIHVSPELKDRIWIFLEEYDLPVVVGPEAQSGPSMGTQVYDMQFELNEIEARREQYPSTISFLNLINALIVEEIDLTDRGRRFIGIFRFVYDHVFGPYPQRAYADPCKKWQLVCAFLKHFHMILVMYDVKEEGYEESSLQRQLPALELLKDFISGKSVFRNIMSILQPEVNSIIAERVLLKQLEILVLDEVITSVDTATDNLIQKIIRTKFKACIMLTIAHRIPTAIDNNQVLVLSNGRVAEFDTPLLLLEDKSSMPLMFVSEYLSQSSSIPKF